MLDLAQLQIPSLLNVLGLDNGRAVDAFFRNFEEVAESKFAFVPLEIFEAAYPSPITFDVGDREAGIFSIGSALFLTREGAYTPIGQLISHLIASQKLNSARTHYPVDNRAPEWQAASAINAMMFLIGPAYGWETKGDMLHLGLRGVDDSLMEIPVDALIKFVRDILSRGNLEELLSPSSVVGGLRAIATNHN